MDGSLNSNLESILSVGTTTTILNLELHHETAQQDLLLAHPTTSRLEDFSKPVELLLVWVMSCEQYRGAVDRLYANEYFKLEENQRARSEIHELFKKRTKEECLFIDV